MPIFNKHKSIKGAVDPIGIPFVKGLDMPLVRGWLARIGDDNPREAILKIDDENFEFICDNFRSDLQKKPINNGFHAFEFIVPLNFIDEKNHIVHLYDKKTGKLIDKDERIWSKRRFFNNFSAFLANSIVLPVINAPFSEEEKTCFATMENITKYLVSLASNLEEKYLFSIIMPVYNRVDIVKSSVDSVLNQTYQNIELVIVDDGSYDGTYELLKSIKDDRIVLIHNETNQGPSRARNMALEASNGKYIAYLDSDNTWDPRYIEAMLGSFLELPDAEAIYSGQMLFRGKSEKPFAIRFGSFNKSLLSNRNYIDLNAFCHTRDVYISLGGFDENLKRLEDWDYFLRISKSLKMYSVPVILSNYYYDNATNTSNDNYDTNFIQSNSIVRKKQNELPKSTSFPKKSIKFYNNVSIIIASYESLEVLQECINSIFELNLKDWVEIIIVDNASSMPVVDYLRDLETKGQIKLIKNKINYGFTYSINQGIKIAKPGNDILLLNNDTIITPGAIEALQNAAYELPQCGLTVPQQVLPGGTTSVGGIDSITTHVPYANPQHPCDVNLSLHHLNIIDLPTFHSGEFVELSFAPFFCVYIKREVLDRSVGLDAEFGRHFRSDSIFCNYIRHIMNLKIYYVADAVVHHKLQKSTAVLFEDSSKKSEVDKILSKNRWDADLAEQTGYKTALWDF